jgi:hypothetical protein
VRSLGRRDVNDPVAEQKFLGFREDAVSDWHVIFLPKHNYGFLWVGQALIAGKFTRFTQVLGETLEACHVRIDVLLGPGAVSIDTSFRAGHQQNVFHVFPSRFLARTSRFHVLVGAKQRFSTSLK